MNIDRMIEEALMDILAENEADIAMAIAEAVERELDIESIVENYIDSLDLNEKALDILLN